MKNLIQKTIWLIFWATYDEGKELDIDHSMVWLGSDGSVLPALPTSTEAVLWNGSSQMLSQAR
jgi:hypothetical protein